jgi:hypothetical protein
VPSAHQPDDIVALAAKFQPDAFQRTFSMFPAFSIERPIPGGYTVGSLLNELSHVARGYHIPRIDAAPGVLSKDQILGLSARLLDMPLEPRIRYLSIDNFPNRFRTDGPTATSSLLGELMGQGWEGIELLVCGTNRAGQFIETPSVSGLAANLVFDVPAPGDGRCADMNGWNDNTVCRDRLRKMFPNCRLFMNIDFPWQIDCFKMLGPDMMAEVFNQVAAGQGAGGYTFIWPVLQVNPPPNDRVGQWDATILRTSAGPTLFDVELSLAQKYNPKETL